MGSKGQKKKSKKAPSAKPASSPAQLVDTVDESSLSEEMSASSLPEGESDIGPTGSLSKTPVARVLFEMYASGVTGALLLSKGEQKKIVYLRSGYPISIKSNILTECLGKLLLLDGQISEDSWRESLVIMSRTGQRQGAVLIQMGVINPKQLADGLAMQARFRLLQTFSWLEGNFKLWPGLRPPADITSFDTAPATLIYEGIRSFMPHKRILEELRPYRRSFLHPSENPLWRYQHLDVPELMEPLLERIDGTTTIEELLRTATTPLPESTALLYMLLCTEIVSHGEKPIKHWNGLKTITKQVVQPPSAQHSTPRVYLARLVERLRKSTPQEILGVPDDAPMPTLRVAFHKKALERHPDRLHVSQSEGLRALAIEALTLTTEAFSQLSGKARRRSKVPGKGKGKSVTDSSRAEVNTALLDHDFPERVIDDHVQRIIAAERHHQRGLSLLDAGRFDDAARVLARAVSACDEEGEFRATLAWAIFQAGLDEASAIRALSHLDEAVLFSPSARVHLFRGNILRFLERNDEAIWAFQEALRKEPENEEARSELERIYEDLQGNKLL